MKVQTLDNVADSFNSCCETVMLLFPVVEINLQFYKVKSVTVQFQMEIHAGIPGITWYKHRLGYKPRSA